MLGLRVRSELRRVCTVSVFLMKNGAIFLICPNDLARLFIVRIDPDDKSVDFRFTLQTDLVATYLAGGLRFECNFTTYDFNFLQTYIVWPTSISNSLHLRSRDTSLGHPCHPTDERLHLAVQPLLRIYTA